MPNLQKQIAEKFLTRLAASPDIDSAKIDQLRILLAAAKKPKVDEIVKVFQHPGGGDIK